MHLLFKLKHQEAMLPLVVAQPVDAFMTVHALQIMLAKTKLAMIAGAYIAIMNLATTKHAVV